MRTCKFAIFAMKIVHRGMKRSAMISAVTVMTVGIAVSGCAFGRKIMDLDVKFGDLPYSLPTENDNVVVVIDKVEDLRSFSPDNGLTEPSIGLSNFLTRLDDSDESKARLVGRTANGFGLPCGDVIACNVTVADHIRRIVEQSFADAGFNVVSPGIAEEYRTIHVSVSVDRFWGWMAYAHCADTCISLRLKRGEMTNSISVYATNYSVAIFGSPSEWTSLFVDNAEQIRARLTEQLRPMLEKYR